MLFASRLHFTPLPLIARTLCVWRETDWGEGITRTTVSLHLFICRLALYPLPHSPRRVLLSTTAPRSSDGYHVDGAAYWSMDNNIGCHGRKKYRPIPILPNTCKYRPIPNNSIPVSFEPYSLVPELTSPADTASSEMVVPKCQHWLCPAKGIKSVTYASKCLRVLQILYL